MVQTQIPESYSEAQPKSIDQLPPTKRSGKMKWLIAGIVIILVVAVVVSEVFFLGKTSPVDAVTSTEPFIVFGVQLQINSTLKQDTYKDPYSTLGIMSPTSPSDTLLVISAKLLSESGSINSWNVTITDSTSRTYETIMTTGIDPQNPSSYGSEEWVFVVPKSQRSFTLNFPDGQQIKLVVP